MQQSRLIGNQIETFKILNGYENIDRNMVEERKQDHRTRSNIGEGSM